VKVLTPIYVVITDFDGWDQTQICLRHLERSSYKNLSVIVVDHGLTDATARGLKEFHSCTRISAESTLWWTGATNIGIRAALERGAQYIMLLNNDCYVAPDTVEQVFAAIDESALQIVAPVQISAHSGEVLAGRITTCFSLGFPTVVLPGKRKLLGRSRDLVPTKMIIGGRGVVIPRAVFAEVGLFDDANLPHYGADHDFYLRCRQANIALAIAPAAKVLMDETRTTVSRNLGRMTAGEFFNSFGDPRSHRNLSVLKTLFRRYYPVKRLYLIGVVLNVTRYCVSYILQRLKYRFAMIVGGKDAQQ
jgi:GT2 family glycosyltransferase